MVVILVPVPRAGVLALTLAAAATLAVPAFCAEPAGPSAPSGHAAGVTARLALTPMAASPVPASAISPALPGNLALQARRPPENSSLPRPARKDATLPPAGWQRFDDAATGSYYLRYIPQSLDLTRPVPLVVFLHGSGGGPEPYMPLVSGAADQAGCVLALPRSLGDGWGTPGDSQTIADSQQQVAAALPVDPARVSIAGHSAGGAFAYLVAYGTVAKYSAVFTLSAPFYPVAAVADPLYKAPIRMYYGTTDPNYSGGAYQLLKQQWARLGIAEQDDIEQGFGHSLWPSTSLSGGFQFLVGQSYSAVAPPTCQPDATHPCLDHGRYRVEVTWQDGSGATGSGTVTSALADSSAVFWFFDPSNWELLVKVIDGCALNQHVWVFAAGTTDVHFTLKVTDTVTGQFQTYQNPGGHAAQPITDTSAFPCS